MPNTIASSGTTIAGTSPPAREPRSRGRAGSRRRPVSIAHASRRRARSRRVTGTCRAAPRGSPPPPRPNPPWRARQAGTCWRPAGHGVTADSCNPRFPRAAPASRARLRPRRAPEPCAPLPLTPRGDQSCTGMASPRRQARPSSESRDSRSGVVTNGRPDKLMNDWRFDKPQNHTV